MATSDTPSGSSLATKPVAGGLARDGSAVKEGFWGVICGLLYGLTSPLIGQPLDTIKTKMQAQPEYMHGGLVTTLTKVVRTEGVMALYKGLVPPLVGSTIFRSIQFGVYNAAYAGMKEYPVCRQKIPGSFGVENRVIVGAVLASTARALIETPLELIKVRKQVGQQWSIPALYTGFGITWARTTVLMTSFFIFVDSSTRHIPDFVNQPFIGPFFKGGICATAAWWVAWPLELLKSQIQAGTMPDATMAQRLQAIRRGGVKLMFRGILPGSIRSLVANGSSMLVFHLCQELRDKYQ